MSKQMIKRWMEGGGRGEDKRRAPRGHFAVYVGEGLRRFEVPLAYLEHGAFQRLLQSSADEFGYSRSRGIVLPCDEATFCSVTQYLASLTSRAHNS
ncbi:hypothetical protein SAY87_002173 [Trapa incisa]|uniref:Uncharacterized protein n=1 Tax=Trapa incisa TaxID=236973 RepID=A0AAN7PUJ4_9MYRT|nr:hypothetical protein SAY87_002173 [Trapa incisa]